MRTIHDVLADETSAAILAQITMNTEGLSASMISKNINIPQSTIYDHLRMLEKDQLIFSEEVKVKNFLKKLWYRTEQKTFPDSQFMENKHYNTSLLSNTKDISSRIRFSQALVRKSLVTLESINEEDFAQIQKESTKPVFMRQFLINEDDYQYIFERIVEIEKKLEENNASSMEDRGALLEKEKCLIFYFGLPDLDKKNKRI
ncbi:MAG: winged helix-turn-helix domain-containing protein [Candidatus Hodarchaeales archaeon]|jgi:predicted transcriptional regulator